MRAAEVRDLFWKLRELACDRWGYDPRLECVNIILQDLPKDDEGTFAVTRFYPHFTTDIAFNSKWRFHLDDDEIECVLRHELAHVRVGLGYDHEVPWQNAAREFGAVCDDWSLGTFIPRKYYDYKWKWDYPTPDKQPTMLDANTSFYLTRSES